MVTVISPTGRMGAAVTSDWLDAPPLGSPIPTTRKFLVNYPLSTQNFIKAFTIRQKFNSDCNVISVLPNFQNANQQTENPKRTVQGRIRIFEASLFAKLSLHALDNLDALDQC